jgi:glutamine amidotransferase
MCRVLGSVAAEPVSLRHELLDAANPLIRQSEQGDSGWGMAAYRRAEGEEPRCMRFPERAAADGELDGAASTEARLFNVHVRRATIGGLSSANTHPFCLGPYSFSHNGTILHFTRLFDPAVEPPGGDTDSEHLFRLVMHHIDSAEPIEGLRYAVKATIERFPFSSLDFLFSDGERLYAYRLGPREMHWLARPGQLLVASERVTDNEDWHSVKQDVLLVLDPRNPDAPHAERLVGDELLALADIRELDGGTEAHVHAAGQASTQSA